MKNNMSSKFFGKKVIVASLFSIIFLGGGFFVSNAHADNGVLGVTQISAVQTYASADATYADGWKWTFNVTVPTGETVLQMKFADWTGSAGTIPAANNLQFYSAQSTNASNEAQAIPITASGVYSTAMYLNPSSDLDANTAGNQIQITLEARIPVGSSGGSYSTSYGINTGFNTPTSTGANPPVITNVQATNIASGGATITWTTNGYGDSEVYFGTQSGNYSSSTSNTNTVSSGGSYSHSVALSGLNASTTYYYEVVSADSNGDIGVSSEYSFPTQTTPIGSLTAAQNNPLSSQYVIPGTPNFEIGSYALTASSTEAVRVNNVSIQTTGIAQFGSPFQNLKVMVNGAQYGLTQATVSSGTAYTFSGTPFVISAGNAVDVNVYADISSSTPSSTIVSPATILTGVSGVGVISSGAISMVNQIAGQDINMKAAPLELTAVLNSALGTQVVSAGTSNLKIGSYSLSASSAEGVNVNTISIQPAPGQSTAPTAFQNLKLFVNGTQFGSTQPTVSNGTTYSFSGSPINVPAGQTVNVDVYADTLSNASGTYSPATALVGYTGVGATSYKSVTYSDSTGVIGQNINFAGQPTLAIAMDSSNPASGLISQNTTGNTLAVFRFTETSNAEAVKVTQMNVTEQVSSSSSNFSNLQLYNGSSLLGTASAPVASGTGAWIYSFSSFSNPLIVPQGSSVSITLKGDAGSYSGNSMADNSTSIFSIATSSIVARGNTSNKIANVSGSASGNPMTVLRGVETVVGTPLTGMPPASFQEIGGLTITSNVAGDTLPKTLILTFNSTAYNASTTGFLSTVVLHDVNGNPIPASASSTNGGINTVTFTIPSTYVVTAGSSYTFTVWGDLSQIPALSNQAQSMTANISANTDYTYLDGITNGASVNLPTFVVPITIVSLTTPVGGQF